MSAWDDPADTEPNTSTAQERAAAALLLGSAGGRGAASRLRRIATEDPSPRVRAAALSALTRCAGSDLVARAIRDALTDRDASVRRRACELAARIGDRSPRTALRATLTDSDPLVVEAAAFALGEHPRATAADARALVAIARGHDDALAREAAVAALGSIGHPAGRDAVVAACSDKPAIRRRAVLALAAFEGDEVDAAIDAARRDRDWQVRDAAELLLRESQD